MTIIHPVPDTVRKLDALEAATRGDLLTAAQERLLASVAEDYRNLFSVGNGKTIGLTHVIEAFKILREDVKFMTGDRRRQTIILLNAVQARGFDRVTAADLSINRRATEFADEMASDVDDVEITDAVGT